MVRIFDIRRPLLFGIALLLLMAVIGPACLVAASEAFGMPMGVGTSAPMDCDSDKPDSLGACPHADDGSAVADSVRPSIDLAEIALVSAEPLQAPSVVGRTLVRAESFSSPPPSHLTPLRL